MALLSHQEFEDSLRRIISTQFENACAVNDHEEVWQVLRLVQQSKLFGTKDFKSDFGTEQFKITLKSNRFDIANCIHQLLNYNEYLLTDRYGILDAIISELDAGNHRVFQNNYVTFYVSGKVYSKRQYKDGEIYPHGYQEHTSFIMKWYKLSLSHPELKNDIQMAISAIVGSVFHDDKKLITEYFVYVIICIMTSYCSITDHCNTTDYTSYCDILSLIDDIAEKIITYKYDPKIIQRIKNFEFVSTKEEDPYRDCCPFTDSMLDCKSIDAWISVLQYFNINGPRLEKILVDSGAPEEGQPLFTDDIAQYVFDTYEPEFITCDKLKDSILGSSMNPGSVNQSPDRLRISIDMLGPKSAAKVI